MLKALILILLLLAPAAKGHANGKEKDMVDLIVEHAQAVGDISDRYKWKIYALEEPLFLQDEENVRDTIDHPIRSFGYRNSRSRTISGAILLGLQNLETPNSPPNPRAQQESLFYKRILFKRRPWFLRILPFVEEYSEAPKLSKFLDSYHDLQRQWFQSVFRYQDLIRSKASAELIEQEKKKKNDILEQWNDRRDRAILYVVSERYSRAQERDPAYLWDRAKARFQTYKGEYSAIRRFGAPFIWSTPPKEFNWHILEDGRGLKQGIEYAIVGIERLWLDNDVLFLRRWDIAETSPWEFELSKGKSCDEGGLIPCIPEKAILVRNSTKGSSNISMWGLLGELLPRVPSGIGKDGVDETNSGWDPSPRLSVAVRLRDNSF